MYQAAVKITAKKLTIALIPIQKQKGESEK
jgi:hypothetical protein